MALSQLYIRRNMTMRGVIDTPGRHLCLDLSPASRPHPIDISTRSFAKDIDAYDSLK